MLIVYIYELNHSLVLILHLFFFIESYIFYNYIYNEIDKLDIKATANDEKATVEIIGNNELVDGENLLTIIVKSEDGKETVTYTITVNKGPLQTVQ